MINRIMGVVLLVSAITLMITRNYDSAERCTIMLGISGVLVQLDELKGKIDK